jgi:hypothetical protein
MSTFVWSICTIASGERGLRPGCTGEKHCRAAFDPSLALANSRSERAETRAWIALRDGGCRPAARQSFQRSRRSFAIAGRSRVLKIASIASSIRRSTGPGRKRAPFLGPGFVMTSDAVTGASRNLLISR